MLDQMSHEETNRQTETPTAGSDAGENLFRQPSKGRKAKNLYTKSERPTLNCRWLVLSLKGLICTFDTLIILPRKKKTFAKNSRATGPPFARPGPSDFYRLSPFSLTL